MRSFLLMLCSMLLTEFLFAQNVGIGTTLPAAKLDVKSTTNYVAQFNGIAPMYIGLFEGDVYKGYLGSYAGAADDIDFGTGSGNALGKLHLTIQAVPKLTLDVSGNVGIGTTTPGYKLHVATGDIFLQSSAGSLKIGYDASNQWHFSTTNGGADLLLRSSPDNNTPTTRFYFTQAGRLGIGTNSPVAPLHINAGGGEVLRVQGTNPWIRLEDNTDGYVGYWWYDGTDLSLYTPHTGSALKFGAGGAYRQYIFSDGRVSINTSAPATGYQLSVNGKIICTEARVQAFGSWPDYVFNVNHKMPSLDELEQQIGVLKHLPGMPSADEVEKEGFDLGDMNKRLLEKVEELTLYIIQLHKQNEQLASEIQEIKKQIKK